MDRSLNEIMDFDHVIRVNADGSITEDTEENPYFELNVDSNGNDEFYLSEGWTLLSGWTGQYSYNGPVMHPSEFIGGGLERHIRETPGYYVALVVEGTSPHEWQVSTFTGTTTCSRCGELPLDDFDMQSECRDDTPAGWTIAYKPLED